MVCGRFEDEKRPWYQPCPIGGCVFLVPASAKWMNTQKGLKSLCTVDYNNVTGSVAEQIIDAGYTTVARGGTIINRAFENHETSKLLHGYRTRKEIVLNILSRQTIPCMIVKAIRQKLQIDEPGKGILFVQDLEQVAGLY